MKYLIPTLIICLLSSCIADTTPKEVKEETVANEENVRENQKEKIIEVEFKTELNEDKSLYKKYCNDRFQFCIPYPKSFIPQPPPQNGDGREFHSPDGKTKIIAYGALRNDDVEELDQSFEYATMGQKTTYKKRGDDWFVVSGITTEGLISYQKTRLMIIDYFGGEETEVVVTHVIEYPQIDKESYGKYCEEIAKSFMD